MSLARPTVSVVVPALDEAEHIEACLDALLRQDYPRERYHVLVVDNASTDDTAARIARYPVTRIVEPIRGIARARNAGVRVARSECIAFTDADCIPSPDWLSCLLEGWDNPATGCFVGEIAGTGSPHLVAQYVEDRHLISQRELLAAMIPVAATGSIAFRSSVFPATGLFDETFRYGEDADFTWRLQKWGGFDIRYNPRAVVRHPHPAALLDFLRRTRHEGLGLAAFRLRHADDIRRPQLFRARYRRTMFKAVLGLAAYPLRVRKERQRPLPLHQALAFPLLDKLHSLSLMSGIAAGLPRVRPPAISPARREPADPAMPCQATGHRDQLIHNLAHDPLFLQPCEPLTRLVREELETLNLEILRAVPDATILLTGSFSVGEGIWQSVDGLPFCRSDYDLVVLSDVPPLLGLPSLRRRMHRHLAQHPLSADLDIAYVWMPLLQRGWITTGGRILAGNPVRAAWLPDLPAPRASSAMTRAFLSLAGARIAPDRFSDRISKALLQGAQAVLLDLCRGQPRREWIGLLSRTVIAQRINEHAAAFGPEAGADVARAAAWLSGEDVPAWADGEQARILKTLRSLQARIRPPSAWRSPLTLLLSAGRLCAGCHRQSFSCRRMIQTLDALTACWTSGDAPDTAKLSCLPGSPSDPGDATPVDRYRNIHAGLAARVGFYPHKILWSRSQGLLR